MSGIFDQIINYSPPLIVSGTVNYKGTWNASTNNPPLSNPPVASTKGDYYVVSTAGTQFSISFAVGDWIISSGTTWEKVDLTDAVSSVFGRTGAVVGDSTDYSAVGLTNTAIGAANPSTGAFTSLSSSSTTTLNGTTIPASKTLVVTTDKLSALAATTSAELAGVISDETGSGSLVFATSPTLVTPILGTPQSGTLTSCTGLPISTGVSGLGTGVATALAVNVGSAGAPVVNGGALGTPSSGTVTNLTGTASININGTVGATTPSTVAATTLSATGGVDSDRSSASISIAYSAKNTNAAGGIEINLRDNAGVSGFEIGYTNASYVGPISAAAAYLWAVPNNLEIYANGGTLAGRFSSTGLAVTGKTSVQLTGTSASGYTAASNSGITLDCGTATNGVINLVGGGDLGVFRSNSSNAYDIGISFGDNSNRILKFTTANTERVRIDSSGNVGINTSSPGQKLSVNGDALVQTNLFIGNASGSMVGATSPSLYSPASATLGISTGGAERLRIDSSGNVGIGTASPGSKLDVNGEIRIGNTVNTVTATLPNRTITMVIGGTTYYIHAKTTND